MITCEPPTSVTPSHETLLASSNSLRVWIYVPLLIGDGSSLTGLSGKYLPVVAAIVIKGASSFIAGQRVASLINLVSDVYRLLRYARLVEYDIWPGNPITEQSPY